MSSYLVDSISISTVSHETGIDARAIGLLNLKATGYRYKLTLAQVSKEFLGITKKEYLRQCEEWQPFREGEYNTLSLIEEILYQCSEGNYHLDTTYKLLVQAKEGLK